MAGGLGCRERMAVSILAIGIWVHHIGIMIEIRNIRLVEMLMNVYLRLHTPAGTFYWILKGLRWCNSICDLWQRRRRIVP